MPWHSHLKPGFPNRLLTDAFLIISVINVSHRAMRLISHMQSWDHLEQGKSTGRKKQKRKKNRHWKKVSFHYVWWAHHTDSNPNTCIIHIFHVACCNGTRFPQLRFGMFTRPSRCWIAAWLFRIEANIQTRPIMHSSIWFSWAGTAAQQLSVSCSERDTSLPSANKLV